jgi:hypothetical protein
MEQSDTPPARESENAPAAPTEQPDWDARLTLQEAAAISGLSYSYLRARVAVGALRTERVGARLHLTTRRWLDDYLRARGTKGGGRGPAPKPLPADYDAPPRRGRPRKAPPPESAT